MSLSLSFLSSSSYPCFQNVKPASLQYRAWQHDAAVSMVLPLWLSAASWASKWEPHLMSGNKHASTHTHASTHDAPACKYN